VALNFGDAERLLGLRPQYDHPYYWAAFAVVGGGLGHGA